MRLIRLVRRFLSAAGVRRRPAAFLRVAYRVPRQAVLVTARHEGREDVWPMDWHIPLSVEPKRYGICITKGSFGEELIRASGAFVVHFVPAAWEDRIMKLGATSGRDVDKFAACELRTGPARVIDAPLLEGVLGWLECRVDSTVDVGDHTLVIARIVHEALVRDAARLHHLERGLGPDAADFERHG